MMLVTIQFSDSFKILVVESMLLISLCFDDFNTKNWSLISSNCYHHNVKNMIKFKVIHHSKLLMISTSNTLKHLLVIELALNQPIFDNILFLILSTSYICVKSSVSQGDLNSTSTFTCNDQKLDARHRYHSLPRQKMLRHDSTNICFIKNCIYTQPGKLAKKMSGQKF